jgi:hypothetical protein
VGWGGVVGGRGVRTTEVGCAREWRPLGGTGGRARARAPAPLRSRVRALHLRCVALAPALQCSRGGTGGGGGRQRHQLMGGGRGWGGVGARASEGRGGVGLSVPLGDNLGGLGEGAARGRARLGFSGRGGACPLAGSRAAARGRAGKGRAARSGGGGGGCRRNRLGMARPGQGSAARRAAVSWLGPRAVGTQTGWEAGARAPRGRRRGGREERGAGRPRQGRGFAECGVGRMAAGGPGGFVFRFPLRTGEPMPGAPAGAGAVRRTQSGAARRAALAGAPYSKSQGPRRVIASVQNGGCKCGWLPGRRGAPAVPRPLTRAGGGGGGGAPAGGGARCPRQCRRAAQGRAQRGTRHPGACARGPLNRAAATR